ncbi:MAG: hypothetical protein M1820_007007 [Bogoriella megaspora]|nr:MAG: hypothetical protein M1820_007007 [Bogoriella megaspora]
MEAQARLGPELQEVQTEALGFTALAGESKVKLLPSPWPADSLPSPTSSLISIASGKGLLAAAGPEQLVIASTSSVRDAFRNQDGGKIKQFTPQLSIPMPRISQVAFSSDENFLVISAQNGGGLAVYDVKTMETGNTQPAFQIGTNGIAVRALIPNPTTDFAKFFSVVTAQGQLMLADMSTRQFVNGPGGPVFKEGVSCVSWSKKGKQLVAGMGDGTAIQMTPDGTTKAEIPRPPDLSGDQHVSSVSWLENDEFLAAYTPSATSEDAPMDSTFHLITRQKDTSNFAFQRFLDPTMAFDTTRKPHFQFISRLLKFPPDLSDLIMVASTGSPDIGLVTKSGTPLSSDVPADQVTNVYTLTMLAIDSRKAQLPVNEESGSDTSVIGMAVDLSATEKVSRPIPGDELEESASPLPALMVLNHEGVLSAWWIVYNNSVRQGTTYPGLTVVAGSSQAKTIASPTPSSTTTNTSAFGGSMQKPTAPTFGQSTFGQASTPSIGMNRSSPWGGNTNASTAQSGGAAFGKPAFGQPAFGQPSQPAFGSASPLGAPASTAFGAASSIGNKSSPWTSQGQGQAQKPPGDSEAKPAANPFGGGGSATSPFGKLTDNKSTASPFSNASSSSPFASMGQKQGGFSSFASLGNNQTKPPGMTTEPSFGSTVTLGSATTGSSFGQPSTVGAGTSTWGTPSTSSGAFGTQPQTQSQEQEMDMGDDSTSTQKPAAPTNSFGLGAGGFSLGSTFKGDGTAKDDLPKPTNPSGGLFSMGLGDALGDSQKVPETPVKKEVEEPKLADIPEKPAPPSSAPPIKQSPQISDAPLPPDPTSARFRAKQKELEALPLPGMETAQVAPTPSKKEKPPKLEELPPLAGSPPVDLGKDSPLSDVPEDQLDEDAGKNQVPPEPSPAAPKASWSFTPQSKPPQEIQKVDSTTQASNTPFSLLNKPAAANFAPPTTRPIASPRSPSPTRNFTTPAAPSGKPLISRPSSRAPSRSENLVSRPASRSSDILGTGTPRPPLDAYRQSSHVATPKAPTPEPPISSLEDEEDERIRQLLASDIQPTKTLDPFIAHNDYAGSVEKTGVPGQIERVYRDVNSMLDTLGLNVRALQSFINGHYDFVKEGGRKVEDLDNDTDEDLQDWCLVELSDLTEIIDTLEERLDTEKVKNIPEKFDDLTSLWKDTTKVRNRAKDLRRLISDRKDPEKQALLQAQPLSAEQAQQQTELRAAYANIQKELIAAEEAVSLLRAQLASIPPKRGEKRDTPTLEAVRRTVAKMTQMVERKFADVTVLEKRMMSLKKGMAALSLNDDGENLARGASPFHTPPSNASKRRGIIPAADKGWDVFHTPEEKKRSVPGTFSLQYSPESGEPSPAARRLITSTAGRSVGSAGAAVDGGPSTPRRTMEGVLRGDVERWNEKQDNRKRILQGLKEAVERKGVRETKFE